MYPELSSHVHAGEARSFQYSCNQRNHLSLVDKIQLNLPQVATQQRQNQYAKI